jgi:hypothetical protein
MVRVFSLTVPGQARANLRDSRAGRDWRRQDFAVASMGEDDPVIYVRLIDHLAGRLIQRCRVLQTVVGRLSQEVQRLRGASRAPRMSLRASQQFRRRRHFGHLADSTHRPILISCASSQYLRRHLSGGTLRWLRSSADVDRSRMPSRAFSSKPYARSVRMNRKRRRALFSYAEEVCAYQISGAPARRSRLALRHVR